MDNMDVLLYSHFGLALRRAGLPLDLMRFAKDDEYATQMLAQALQSTDLEVLKLALQIADRRGVLNGTPAGSAPPSAISPRATAKPKPSKSDDDDDDDPPPRFVRSLR